jgi:membrane protein DedA with SNARE-associated domain
VVPESPGLEATRPRPSRRTARLLIIPIICLVIASQVGDALTTTLADEHPLLLVMLNARNRILILTTNQLDALSYYGVATVRLLASDPLFYLLGMFYGDTAVTWLEERTPSIGNFLRSMEQLFAKAAYPLVFIMPNNFICLFSGAAGMKIRTFIALNVSGTIARLYLIRRLGESFEKPIDSVLDFFADYRLPLLVVSIALTVLFVVLERRKGGSEIEVLLELEHELEQTDGAPPSSDIEQRIQADGEAGPGGD